MSAYNYITVGNNWVDVYSAIQVVSGEESLRITNSSGDFGEPVRIWLYLPAIGANTETEGLIRFAWDVLD